MKRRLPIPEQEIPRGGAQEIPTPPDAEAGPPPPWAALSAVRRAPSFDHVVGRVAARGPGQRRGDVPQDVIDGARQSAVLVPIYPHDDDVMVIMTRRASDMRHHKGEVSFPGGRRDPEDQTLWHTAVREAWEETALAPELPQPVGELDSFVTVGSRSLVHPLVGGLDARPELEASPAEVAHIIHAPLSELLMPEVYRSEIWHFRGRTRTMHFFDLVGDTVWGATAAMLHQFLAIATGTGDGLDT